MSENLTFFSIVPVFAVSFRLIVSLFFHLYYGIIQEIVIEISLFSSIE